MFVQKISDTVTLPAFPAAITIAGDVSEGVDAAKSVANGAIDTVDGVLESLRTTGGDALSDAVAAIEQLGGFSPGAIEFSYDIPAYQQTTFRTPDALSLETSELPEFPTDILNDLAGDLGINPAIVKKLTDMIKGATKPATQEEITALANDLDLDEAAVERIVREAEAFWQIEDVAPDLAAPDAGSFEFEVQSVTPDDAATARPDPLSLEQPEPPSDVSAVAPPDAPQGTDIAVPAAPDLSLPSPPSLADVSEPQLVPLVMPEMSLPDVPTYVPVDVGAPPALPEIAQNPFDPSTARYTSSLDLAFFRPELDFARAIGPRVTAREIRSATTRWADDGQILPDGVVLAQSLYRTTMSRLANAGEQRRIDIDTYYAQRELLLSESDGKLKQWQQLFAANEIPLQKIAFDTATLYADTYFSLLKALTELYNARVAAFSTESAVFRASVESAVAKIERWKAQVDAEISKSKVNEQLAQVYGTKVQARSTQAELYEASVTAVNAQVEAYRARMEAFATEAEVARVKLGVYKGEVDAYIGSLSAYKAKFEVYEARVRGTSAANQLEEIKTKVAMAEMQAAGADNTAKEIKIQIEAEKLKLNTRKEAASYETKKLTNIIETVKAQIAGDVGKQRILQWGANVQLEDVQNDAVATEAQAAAKYYNAASDSAYRASEQAFRAMLSAVQAANIAQDAASRSAASVAQGAYSAVHVNAGLQGNGRVSGDESSDVKQNQSVSDFLSYSESKQLTLSV